MTMVDAPGALVEAATEWADGLDLTAPAARATFRTRVTEHTADADLALLCAAAQRAGAANPPGTCTGARRALCDVLISRALVARRRL